MTTQDTHTNVQPVRRVYESEHSTNTSTSSTSAEAIHLVCHPDPSSGKDIILWDDILAAFKDDVVHVRSGTIVLPFLKGPDFKNLDPLRIAAAPGITLDVVVRRQLNANSESDLGSQTTPEEVTQSSSDAKESELFSDSDESFSCPPPEYSSIVTQDLTETERKARLGDKDAQVALGDMYRHGQGVEKDYQAAMEWYIKAAEQGDMLGQSKVAYLYRDGKGVKQDYSAAMTWYLRAADQGLASAQCNVAYLIEEGGTLQDYTQAKDWYQKAVDQGHAPSQCNLGYMYEHGRGVLQDYSQAMKLYLMAADQAHATAQQNIGNMYLSGRGVRQDFDLAMEWYRKAADQGMSSAYYHIGLLYERGRGVEVNREMAREWYTKAINGGSTTAKARLEGMDQQEIEKGEKKRGLFRRIFN